MLNSNHHNDTKTTKKKRKEQKKCAWQKFDYSRYGRRHLALLISYLGWDFDGLVTQENTQNTVEEKLLEALEKTCLLESRDSCGIQRCGRTDKGVSAFHQVISIDLRSNLSQGLGVFIPDGHQIDPSTSTKTMEDEIRYSFILNRVLPVEIRVLAWAELPARSGGLGAGGDSESAGSSDWSARHNCRRRTYKYLIPRSNLNLKAMKEGADHLIGVHDFRNFCKARRGKDANATTVRNIMEVDLKQVADTNVPTAADDPHALYELTIVASAFLWHQIRCIVGMLLLVAEEKEAPSIVREALDVESGTFALKPDYPMASEIPLCLFHAEYPQLDPDDRFRLEWKWETDEVKEIARSLQRKWTEFAIKTQIVRNMMTGLSALSGVPETDYPVRQHEMLYPFTPSKNYTKMQERGNQKSTAEEVVNSNKISSPEMKKLKLTEIPYNDDDKEKESGTERS